MQPAVADMLAKRRDRCIAIVLGVKEREIDEFLPPEARSKLRKVVLDQINDLHDACVEVMRSFDTGDSVINQLWLDKINEMHDVIVGNGNGHG
jgi:hypothetical protein